MQFVNESPYIHTVYILPYEPPTGVSQEGGRYVSPKPEPITVSHHFNGRLKFFPTPLKLNPQLSPTHTDLSLLSLQLTEGMGLPARSVPHTRVAESPSNTATVPDPAPLSPAPTVYNRMYFLLRLQLLWAICKQYLRASIYVGVY